MYKFITYFFISFLTLPVLGQMDSVDVLFHWKDDNIVGSTVYDNAYNEIWGFAQNGEEYAVIGSTDGTHIFNVTNPSDAYEAAFIAGAYTGTGVIHRDYHDYNGYLYAVCDEGSSFSTMQIIDITGLPDAAPVVYDSNDLIRTSHNIFIDTASARLYACAGRAGNNQNFNMRIYDLEEPVDPQLIYNFEPRNVHDMYVRNDTCYMNSEGNGLYVVDFSDINEPVALGNITEYVDKGYNHSGWLSDDGNTYFLADETWGMDIKVIDVSDMSDINVINTITSNIDADATIAHNLLYHKGYLFVSYYYDGLQVYDMKDPENPELVRYYDTSPLDPNFSYKGAWGVYPHLPSGNILISDMQEGLFVLDVNLADFPEEIIPEDTMVVDTMVVDTFVMSIGTIPYQTLNIQPNLIENYFSISGIAENETAEELRFYSESGQMVYRENISEQALENLKRPYELGSGFYLVELVFNNKKRLVGKVVLK